MTGQSKGRRHSRATGLAQPNLDFYSAAFTSSVIRGAVPMLSVR